VVIAAGPASVRCFLSRLSSAHRTFRLLAVAALCFLGPLDAAAQSEDVFERLSFPEAPAVSSCPLALAKLDDGPVLRPILAPKPGAGSRRLAPPLAAARALLPEQDLLARAHTDGAGRLRLSGASGERVLTIEPALQDALTQLLESYQTPYAAVVVLEPSTGRVLAMAEHSEADPSMRGLATKAVFPAASVFKLVTATALLDAGLGPDDVGCAHGGKRHIQAGLLEDSRADQTCLSLAEAMGRSANAVFAKLTHQHLRPEQLLAAADALHFNRPFDFPVPTDISVAQVPEDALGLATTGAGFGDVYLSPLHGAMLASVAANRGLWRPPVLFEDQVDLAAPTERVLSSEQATALVRMMEETVTHGTARRFFRGSSLRTAVGKTGSLADKPPLPYRDYTWFVGFAPRDAPRVAVAAVVVNDLRWRIHAPWLAGEALRLVLQGMTPLHARR
jgi:peptidoglycan glycosyltransferase